MYNNVFFSFQKKKMYRWIIIWISMLSPFIYIALYFKMYFFIDLFRKIKKKKK